VLRAVFVLSAAAFGTRCSSQADVSPHDGTGGAGGVGGMLREMIGGSGWGGSESLGGSPGSAGDGGGGSDGALDGAFDVGGGDGVAEGGGDGKGTISCAADACLAGSSYCLEESTTGGGIGGGPGGPVSSTFRSCRTYPAACTNGLTCSCLCAQACPQGGGAQITCSCDSALTRVTCDIRGV
jgi:hypothetical protein